MGGVSGLPCPESQQLSQDRYRERMAPVLGRWRERAADKALGLSRRAYAQRRVDALERDYQVKLDRCSTAGVVVKCRCPGRRDVRWYSCRQHLMCGVCQRARSKRLGARMRAALEARAAEQPELGLVLVTLTLRHSGDVAVDRAALARGWREFYKRYHRRYGRFSYVGVWEVTPGGDGLGHVHAHVAVLWPTRGADRRDWGDVRELWLASCPESERITFVASRRDRRPTNAQSAAKYLSKYVSKGVQTADFSPELRADVVAAAYNTRWLFASRGIWVPFEPVCPDCQTKIIRAQFRFDAWHWRYDISIVDRGLDPPGDHTQLGLAIPEPDERTGGGGFGFIRPTRRRTSH